MVKSTDDMAQWVWGWQGRCPACEAFDHERCYGGKCRCTTCKAEAAGEFAPKIEYRGKCSECGVGKIYIDESNPRLGPVSRCTKCTFAELY